MKDASAKELTSDINLFNESADIGVMNFDQVYKLYAEAKFSEIIDLLNDIEERQGINCGIIYWRSKVRRRLGRFEDACKELKTRLSEDIDFECRPKLMMEFASNLWSLGKYLEVRKLIDQVESIITKLPHGMVRPVSQELYRLKGVTAGIQGNVKSASNYFILSRRHFLKEDLNSPDYWILLLNFAMSQMQLGNLKKAKHLLLKIYNSYSKGGRVTRGYTDQLLGTLLHLERKFDLSLKFLLEANTYWRNKGNSLELSGNLIEMILLAQSMNDKEMLEKYHNELVNLDKLNQSNIIHARALVGSGIYWFSHSRPSKKVKSIEFFKEVLSEEIYDSRMTLIAMLHYVEILMIDYNVSQYKKTFLEIIEMVNTIIMFSEGSAISNTYIYALQLLSKLEMMQGEYATAVSLLDKANKLAYSAGYRLLAKQGEEQKEMMMKQLYSIQNMLHKNEETINKMVEADIMNYLHQVKNIIT